MRLYILLIEKDKIVVKEEIPIIKQDMKPETLIKFIKSELGM